jgi:hypothetical protein
MFLSVKFSTHAFFAALIESVVLLQKAPVVTPGLIV